MLITVAIPLQNRK